MSELTLIKKKFLSVASSGIYLSFKPAELNDYYEELDQFLLLNTESLEAVDLFNLLEFQFCISLMTNHDVKAKTLLDSLIDQFDIKRSQRLKLLKSLYLEATGSEADAMNLLDKDKNELRLSRRLTTFSRRTNNKEEYINNLNYYLSVQPLDLVTWAELADEYQKLGHYDEAVFCLKEILLNEPFAYPIFYKVGLNYYYQFLQSENKIDSRDQYIEAVSILTSARDNFLRCIEICDVYTKAWVGLYLITDIGFNDKLLKYKTVQEVATYLEDNKKIKPLSIQKIMALEDMEDEKDVYLYLKRNSP
ncbi:uncharacterized protein PRCAT00005674001 [Priceomyces carsonii]|uniref:uncharacterized protein n=1 Tax=Priceomyces carsonii TaxID=28549 RepID=UPI002EDB91FC|nr:unnamed protein product [Priceomyces carsonii]